MSTQQQSGQESAAVTFSYSRAEHTGMLGKRDTGELVLLATCAAIGIILAAMPFPIFLRLLFLVGWCLAGIAMVYAPYKPRGRRVERRTFYKWFEINRSYKRLLRDPAKARWRNRAREKGTSLDGQPMPVIEPPGIGRVLWTSVEMPSYGDNLAVLLFPQRNPPCLTCAVEIEGPGLTQLDELDQLSVLVRWRRSVLDQIGNGSTVAGYLQLLERVLPDDPQAHENYIAERGDPSSPAWLRESYDGLAASLPTSAEQHRCLLVLRVDYTPDLVETAGTPTTLPSLARVVADEMSQVLARLKETDIRLVQLMGVAQTAAWVRNTFLPHHRLEDVALTRNSAWPQTLDCRPEQYLLARDADSEQPAWMTSTAAIAEWPFEQVGINFLRPLLMETQDVVRTISIVMRLEPSDKALDRVLMGQTNLEAEGIREQERGRREDPRDKLAKERLEEMAASLVQGAAGAAVVGYIGVTVPADANLRSARSHIESRARAARLRRLEWCDLEQWRAFTNLLPFCGGIE